MNKIIGRTIITVTEPANAYKNLREPLLVSTSHSVECYDTSGSSRVTLARAFRWFIQQKKERE